MIGRSIQAQDISGAAVTGDRNIVLMGNTLVFGDSGARLTLDRRQRPAIRRGNPSELDILLPQAGVLSLQGRQGDLANLRAWLENSADLSVHALIGQAGSGKTRLALELCAELDPAEAGGPWRAGFIRPSEIATILAAAVTRHFIWDVPTLLVVDYAATAHRALGNWLDHLAQEKQAAKLRFLLLEREAPENFGWWVDLRSPALHSDSPRKTLFYKPWPDTLPGLADTGQRRALFCAAQCATHKNRPGASPLPLIPNAGEDPAFDRLLAEPRFGNPLNLAMAGLLACDQSPLGALGLRRLDAALELANRQLARLGKEAAAHGIEEPVIRHIAAFNGLAGGLPLATLPATIAEELAAWGTAGNAHAIAECLAQEYPPQPGATETLLSITQPDLIGEALIILAFEGPQWRAAEATPTVRRAYALGQRRAADVLMRLIQDFAYALEERGAAPEDVKRGKAVLNWLTELVEQMPALEDLLPLVSALPAQTLVLREAAVDLTSKLSESVAAEARCSGDMESLAKAAMLLNNLSIRLSTLGRHDSALGAAEESVRLSCALADARPGTFTSDLAMSLNTLANSLSKLGRDEAALVAAEQSARICRALAEARPDTFTSYLAMSLTTLSNRLHAVGRCANSLAAAEESAHLYRALANNHPDAFTSEMALSLSNLAIRLRALGQNRTALPIAAESVQLHRALAESRPDSFMPHLAASLHNLAIGLGVEGRRTEALAAEDEAVNIYRCLAGARPSAFAMDLARALCVAGCLLADLEDGGRGVSALSEAIELVIPTLAAYPAAVSDVITVILQSYQESCVQAGCKPDEKLLVSVEEIFERLV